ncbi:hypothetical protein BC629DRAFT_1443095 [Irpex lacteus]|nr:hypothetical protein BC629DRAFT_1443095 [Irpex lacteus]
MRQDSLQLYEPSPSSRSVLEAVVSEVTDSEAERLVTVMQDPSHAAEPLSYSKSRLVGVVSEQTEGEPDGLLLYRNSGLEGGMSEVTESEAGRLLASRIPPELFEDILFYVNVNRVSQRRDQRPEGEDLTRNRGLQNSVDILADLKSCSLVCLFWANICRQYMFSGKTVEITCYEDAEVFVRHVVRGCPRITPVHRLIRTIDVKQFYSSRWAPPGHESKKKTSFLHLLYLPVIRDKLQWLFIYGPVPDDFNPARLDTPHWSIPPSMVVPNTFLRDAISIKSVHLPSFYHVTKYIRHFSCLYYISFKDLTWDGQTSPLLPQASSMATRRRRPASLSITAAGCTDAVHLALTALMLNPNCPLHRLGDEERVSRGIRQYYGG